MLMASAEAVMALGTGAYNGLATVDVWTLLVGQTPNFALQPDSSQFLTAIGSAIMAMPAWVAFAASGFLAIHVCRKRQRRTRRRAFHSAI